MDPRSSSHWPDVRSLMGNGSWILWAWSLTAAPWLECFRNIFTNIGGMLWMVPDPSELEKLTKKSHQSTLEHTLPSLS